MTAREPETLSGDPSLLLPEFDTQPADPPILLKQWLDSAARCGA